VRFLLGPGSWGAVVPHAPLLIPDINPAFAESEFLASFASVVERRADLIVLVSGHGERTGVYARSGGSLASMSLPAFVADGEVDPDANRELALEWGEPRLEGEADHGVVVPLLLGALPSDTPIVCCALAETTGPGRSFSGPQGRTAASLAAAIAAFAGRRRVGVIASAHTSAGLAAHGPLTLRPGAQAFEERVLDALASDVGRLLEIDEAAWHAGDPCGRGPLLVLSHLFQGRSLEVHGYDTSTGVGYVVASTG
jgi:hypothetical protein